MQSRIWVAGDFLLAFVPVILANVIARGMRADALAGRPRRRVLWGSMLLAWLIFLPNTAYLLTEWRHYVNIITEHPLYRHIYRGYGFTPGGTLFMALFTAFYFIYAGSGIVSMFLAIRPLDRLLTQAPARIRNLWRGVIFLLCSFGVFLGFVEKLNSWQILSGRALYVIARGAWHVMSQPALAIVVIGFAGFLWAAYRALVLFENGLIHSRSERTIL